MDFADLVDPELRESLFRVPPGLDPAEDLEGTRRRMLERAPFAGSADQQARVQRTDLTIPGPPDNADGVRVRVYEPRERAAEALPGLLWVHGGGFCGGAVDQDDGLCTSIVDEIGAVIVSVDYRLAPEHPFPAGPEDCYAALRWLFDTAHERGVTRSRIGVAGYSSGAGFAAALALMARDRGECELAFQVLLCPLLDVPHRASSRAIVDPRVRNQPTTDSSWRLYLGDAYDAPPAYAAPARAADLSGLPPAYLAVSQFDVNCEEDIEYARRLLGAGVATELHVFPRGFHGFELLVPDAQISRDAVADRTRALRRALHPSGE
ncbi:Carboxylesterase NlhH [Baekduia alba]|uniref:alpha/beta hydrolase n=1 Tax=Baekduia alba TaxID=2997333 RepID=UPI00233F8041|nr:alpha/beta hydrolase [Baekduia alba]WCB91778.1 Carboxylesterase NlhH [Baekduia alba]